jgi:hypothetical protein
MRQLLDNYNYRYLSFLLGNQRHFVFWCSAVMRYTSVKFAFIKIFLIRKILIINMFITSAVFCVCMRV